MNRAYIIFGCFIGALDDYHQSDTMSGFRKQIFE
jgi:hypothetical protein